MLLKGFHNRGIQTYAACNLAVPPNCSAFFCKPSKLLFLLNPVTYGCSLLSTSLPLIVILGVPKLYKVSSWSLSLVIPYLIRPLDPVASDAMTASLSLFAISGNYVERYKGQRSSLSLPSVGLTTVSLPCHRNPTPTVAAAGEVSSQDRRRQ